MPEDSGATHEDDKDRDERDSLGFHRLVLELRGAPEPEEHFSDAEDEWEPAVVAQLRKRQKSYAA